MYVFFDPPRFNSITIMLEKKTAPQFLELNHQQKQKE